MNKEQLELAILNEFNRYAGGGFDDVKVYEDTAYAYGTQLACYKLAYVYHRHVGLNLRVDTKNEDNKSYYVAFTQKSFLFPEQIKGVV